MNIQRAMDIFADIFADHITFAEKREALDIIHEHNRVHKNLTPEQVMDLNYIRHHFDEIMEEYELRKSMLFRRNLLFKAQLPGSYDWVCGDLYRNFDVKTAFIISHKYSLKDNKFSMIPVCHEIDSDTICQYTGRVVSDAHPSMIWENDVFYDPVSKLHGRVKWDDEYAGFVIDWYANYSTLVLFGIEGEVECGKRASTGMAEYVDFSDFQYVGNIFDL